MESFKYRLDKSSKKFICPSCKKKTFVYYVDTASGEYLTSNYGRCDREQNCGYHYAPAKGERAYLIEFLRILEYSNKAMKLTTVNGLICFVPKSIIKELTDRNCFIPEWFLKDSNINYLGNESKVFTSDNGEILNAVTIKKPDPIKPSYYSLELLNEMYLISPIDDAFSIFLRSIFTTDEVLKATKNYFLTGTNCAWYNRNDSTVFWRIDTNERIRGAKVMQYDKNTGKRIKQPYNLITWIHKVIKDKDFNLTHCLFGLHLINNDYQKDIAIVESEKTAVIMSILIPDFIWLATGGKGMFKDEILKPLKNRNCFAYPDNGEFDNWNKIAIELKTKGYKIAVSNVIESKEYKNGFDLADFYLSGVMHEMHEMYP